MYSEQRFENIYSIDVINAFILFQKSLNKNINLTILADTFYYKKQFNEYFMEYLDMSFEQVINTEFTFYKQKSYKQIVNENFGIDFINNCEQDNEIYIFSSFNYSYIFPIKYKNKMYYFNTKNI